MTAREQKHDMAERIQAIVNYAPESQKSRANLTDLLRLSPETLTTILAALRRGDLVEPAELATAEEYQAALETKDR